MNKFIPSEKSRTADTMWNGGPIPVIRQLIHAEPKEFERMVEWMHEWWGRVEGYSREEVVCYMAHSLNETRLPQTYGLFLRDELIGMYQFTYSDLDIRPDIYPWLANVFIDPAHRGHGFMGPLISSAIKNAQKNGFSELFLFTSHIGLYERYGFIFTEEIDTYTKNPRYQRLYRLPLAER